ncbi:FtsH protease activity modulator HflK, partial [bacterium]|nr:FtsH protease activity modulator HflK [bacterium]
MSSADRENVEEFLRNVFRRGEKQSPRIPLGPVLLAVVALLAIQSSFYTIDPEEVGIVLRFGEYVRTTDPGLHLRLPFGIERIRKVPVQRQLKEEFGFRTVVTGQRSQYARDARTIAESLMLTGDLNIADVEWIVQYKVVEPVKYLFQVRDARETFRNISEAVMRSVIGDRSVDEVLTSGRQEAEDRAVTTLQRLCEQYDLGIDVQLVALQDVNPPDPVKPSFNEVNQAEQERETLINQAKAELNRAIPKAEGEAKALVQAAEGYAIDRVNRAAGEAARFTAVHSAYRKAPQVTRRRLYLETMGEVLPNVGKTVIVDESVKGLLPLLDVGSMTRGG